MWRSSRDRHPDIDPLADRLLASGLLLLLLSPLLLTIFFCGILSWPVYIGSLPRDRQPVPAASAQESLLLITTLSGPGGREASQDLDRITNHAVLTNYYYNMRVGWLRQSPASAEEAATLLERYRADLILWGEVQGDQIQLHIQAATPLHYSDPRGLEFNTANTASALTFTGSLLHGLHLLQAGSADTYLRSYAQPVLNNLWQSREVLPFECAELPYYLALSYGQDNRTQGILTLEESLEEGEVYLPSLMLLAEYQQFSGDLAGALDALDRALLIDPDLALQSRRGTLLLALGRHAEAILALEAALLSNPNDTGLRIQLAEALLLNGDIEEGEALYAELVAAEPRNVTLRVARIDALLSLGDRQGALTSLRELLATVQADPTLSHYEADLRIKLGFLLLEMDRDEEAEVEFQQVKSLRPYQVDGPLGLGIILWRADQRSEALSEWTRWINSSGGGDSGSLLIVNGLLTRGYPEAALAFATERLTRSTSSYSYDEALLREARADVYVTLGEFQLALDDLLEAYRLISYAPDANYYRIMGDALAGLGDTSAALDAYREYLYQAPNAPDRAEIEARIEALQQPVQGAAAF